MVLPPTLWRISPWRIADRFNFKDTAKSAKAQPVSWILLLYFILFSYFYMILTRFPPRRKQRCYLTYAANRPIPHPTPPHTTPHHTTPSWCPARKAAFDLSALISVSSPLFQLWAEVVVCPGQVEDGDGVSFTFTTLVVHWFRRFDEMLNVSACVLIYLVKFAVLFFYCRCRLSSANYTKAHSFQV